MIIEETRSENFFGIVDQDNLLMNRGAHLWVYEGFEHHFQKLFDDESHILFQNWTIHSCYGTEVQNLSYLDTFLNEILSSNEIEKIKKNSIGEPEIQEKLYQMKQKQIDRKRISRKQTYVYEEK